MIWISLDSNKNIKMIDMMRPEDNSKHLVGNKGSESIKSLIYFWQEIMVCLARLVQKAFPYISISRTSDFMSFQEWARICAKWKNDDHLEINSLRTVKNIKNILSSLVKLKNVFL